jgi:hypothetical protein
MSYDNWKTTPPALGPENLCRCGMPLDTDEPVCSSCVAGRLSREVAEAERLVRLSYVDTCSGDYLTDHHNRQGECLVGVAEGSLDDMACGLVEELEVVVGDRDFPSVEQHALLTLARRAVRTAGVPTKLSACDDASCDCNYESGIYAWFLVTWNERTDRR